MKRFIIIIVGLFIISPNGNSQFIKNLPPRAYLVRMQLLTVYSYSYFGDQREHIVVETSGYIGKVRLGIGLYSIYKNINTDLFVDHWIPLHVGISVYEINNIMFDVKYKAHFISNSETAYDEMTANGAYYLPIGIPETSTAGAMIKLSIGYRNFWNNSFNKEDGLFFGITFSYAGFLSTDPKLLNRDLLQYSSSGNFIKVKEMLDVGGDINTKNNYGDTPLNLAIKNKHSDISKELIKCGAEINSIGELGNTPLHNSVYTNQREITDLLVDNGANYSFLNEYGLNPKEMEGLPQIDNCVATTVQLLNSNGSWIDRQDARVYYNRLLNYQSNYVINSLALLVIRKPTVRLRTLVLAIKLGINESEEKLAKLLMVYGDKYMAEDYLNCGSSILAFAAREWAHSNGYDIRTGRGSNRAVWGKF